MTKRSRLITAQEVCAIVVLLFLPLTTMALPPTNSLSWPIQGKMVKDISLFFGVEDSAGMGRCSKEGHFPIHIGIDIVAQAGTEVYPVKEGIVKRVNSFGGEMGYYVVVSHDNNTWTSLYGHLQPQSTAGIIKEEMWVSTSTSLGKVLKFPSIHAPDTDIDHLHFGIRNSPYNTNPDGTSKSTWGFVGCNQTDNTAMVDPLLYLGHNYYVLQDDGEAYNIGSWTESTSVGFYHGKGYRVLPPGSDPDPQKSSATYTVWLWWGGWYKIYTRWTSATDRTPKAKYTIKQQGNPVPLTKVVDQTKDQRNDKLKWTEIGNAYLYPLKPVAITVTNGSTKKDGKTGKFVTDANLISDAILVEWVGW